MRRRIWRPDWLAVAVALLSMATTVGAWVWGWAKLEQRMVANEQADAKQDEQIIELTRENGSQTTAIAVTSTQYADIIRRLDGIERKIDRERR